MKHLMFEVRGQSTRRLIASAHREEFPVPAKNHYCLVLFFVFLLLKPTTAAATTTKNQIKASALHLLFVMRAIE